MMALLGLAVLAVTAIASRYVAIAAGVRAFALAALGVGAAWLINLDLFSVLGIETRDSAIGVTVAGLMMGARRTSGTRSSRSSLACSASSATRQRP